MDLKAFVLTKNAFRKDFIFWKLVIEVQGLEISSVEETWVKIRDSIKASAKEKVGILETNRNKPGLMRNVQN